MKSRSVTTSMRTGVVVVTVAVRGTFETRATTEEVALGLLFDGLAVLDHLDVAVEQDEELAPALTLANRVLPGRQLDLVGDRGDLAELLVAPREQRCVLQQVDFLVPSNSSEAHGRSLSRKTGCRPRSYKETGTFTALEERGLFVSVRTTILIAALAVAAMLLPGAAVGTSSQPFQNELVGTVGPGFTIALDS